MPRSQSKLLLSPILSTVVSKVILPCATAISLTSLIFTQHKLSLAKHQIENLTQTVSSGNRDKEQLNEQIQKLNAEIKRLSVEVGNKDIVVARLTQQIQNLNEDFNQVNNSLATSIDRNDDLSNRITELERQLNDSNASCEQAIQEKTQLERQIFELRADVLKCQAENKQGRHALEENVQRLTMQLQSQQNMSNEQVNSLQEAIARYQAQIADIRRKSLEENEKSKQNEQKLKQLQTQFQQLQKDKDQELQNIRQEFENRLTELKEKLKNCEKEANDKNRQLQIQLKNSKSNSDRKDARIKELQKQVTDINKLIDERNKNISTLEQRLCQLSTEISSKDERIRELSDQIQTLNNDIDQLMELPGALDIGAQTLVLLSPPQIEGPSASASDIYTPLVPNDTKTIDATSDNFYHKSRKLTMIDKSTEEIFSQEPTIIDINQGGLGDCYYLTAIGCVVHRHPNFIKSMIKDNGDGTVTVRFYDKNYNEAFYKIKKSIPNKNVQCKNCLWIQLLEKAYVVHKSKIYNKKKYSYKNISGGYEHFALKHILGNRNHGSISWKNHNSHYISEDKYDKIKLGSYSREALLFLDDLEKRSQTQLLTASDIKHNVSGHTKGIYDHHAYAILKIERNVETRTGKKLNLITLRNPHGKTIPQYILDSISGTYDIDKAPIDNNGIFKMDLNDFLKYFSKFDFCEL